MRLSLTIIYACIQVKQNEFGWLYGKLYPSWFGLLYTPDITQNSLKMCMMKLKIIQNNTIAVLVLRNYLHGFTVRVLSNLTQEIEEVLTRPSLYCR